MDDRYARVLDGPHAPHMIHAGDQWVAWIRTTLASQAPDGQESHRHGLAVTAEWRTGHINGTYDPEAWRPRVESLPFPVLGEVIFDLATAFAMVGKSWQECAEHLGREQNYCLALVVADAHPGRHPDWPDTGEAAHRITEMCVGCRHYAIHNLACATLYMGVQNSTLYGLAGLPADHVWP